MRQDMADQEIVAYLQDTQRLAAELGIGGAPAFVIGDTLAPGAVDGAHLRQLIAEARSGG